MIWIATLCLLAVIAWLFFNALNERRWVEAHSHDESVAADPGFLPDMSGLTAKVMPASAGTRSFEYENSSLARAVDTVREKSVKAVDTAREKSAKAAGTIERQVAEVRAGGTGDTALGRAIGKITGTARELDAKLDQRSRERAAAERDPNGTDGSLLERATARAAQTRNEIGNRVRERVARTGRVDGGTVGQVVDAEGKSVSGDAASGDPATKVDRKGGV